MKPSITSQAIILEREQRVVVKQEAYDKNQENGKILKETLEQEKEDLASFKKTLEVTA